MKNIRSDTPEHAPDGVEKDACAIYISARKQGQSTFGTLKRSLGALVSMGHRTGFVNGEGDGAGVQTDIPRQLWAKKLSLAGLPSHLATQSGFWVGHFFVPDEFDVNTLRARVTASFETAGMNVLLMQPGRVRKEALGQNARLQPPVFWQAAGYAELPDLERQLLAIQTSLEGNYPLVFASLSPHTVVYKIRGSVETLAHYYPDIQDHAFTTSMVLCHARYSTNTVSTFERAQPFALLGHNGEINTIQRLRLEGRQIGALLPRDGSDSQDMDRILHTLCAGYGLDLIEAMEMLFPPVPHEIAMFPPGQRIAYQRLRQAFGPYAQGPAAVVARYGSTIVASVDALGLRPLWFVETEKEFIFSSERGAIPLEIMVSDAQPIAPGEKIAVICRRGESPVVLKHSQIRQHVMVQTFQREAPQLASQYWSSWVQRSPGRVDYAPGFERGAAGRLLLQAAPTQTVIQAPVLESRPEPLPASYPWQKQGARCIDTLLLAANGWLKDNLNEVADLVSENKDDLISSLGYDGPLAALSKVRVNIADFFKESVAVVTNPAIDHLREGEAFSTSSMVGACAPIGKAPNPEDILVDLELPVVLGGHPQAGSLDTAQKVARQFGTLTLEEVIAAFQDKAAWLDLAVPRGAAVQEALDQLALSAVTAVQDGKQCLVLDDSAAMQDGFDWLDPHLAVSRIDEALRQAPLEAQGNLRRRAGLVVRSAAIRNLHDLALLCGFGADAINPYAMFANALATKDGEPSEEKARLLLTRLVENLHSGLEKVTSTMGCHELRGYGRVCSSIGLSPTVAGVFGTANYFGSESAGVTWERINAEARQRGAEMRGEIPAARPSYQNRIYPSFWKTAHSYAKGEVEYDVVQQAFQKLSIEKPVALRHLLGVKSPGSDIQPCEVDLTIQDYDYPLVIEAMSFGSQGEASFRAYIQAATAMNILCINGEGGELPEIMGHYKRNRGQQVASGRFGVNVEFMNSAVVLEIKIGQGAKPGEGGMLPGKKVTPKVAKARFTPPHVTLISPSNNHDLYSIEDLAQLIEELKIVNPQAKISVKVPVVPGIGVIAVGIAKAGADIINISGYDGGTGAARAHSLQYVGLPTEVGIIQAHRALADSGLRCNVELWANGGMKTGEDAIKMILLGANRVGFGTMAMVALGCTICRQCNLGTCHVGIATQIQTDEEAQQNGLKHFKPLTTTEGYLRIVRLFNGIAEEMRQLTARLGAKRLQDLVGRADLLEQVQLHEQIDLSTMFDFVPVKPRPEHEKGVGMLLTRPRNSLTTILTDLVLQTIAQGEREVTYQDSVTAIDRALGSRLAGELIRRQDVREYIDTLHLRFGPSSLAGNGFAAWSTDQIDIIIEGGVQDGAAKGASGGRLAVMKGHNHDGVRIDGSVGKSFAYGAQDGVLIVQGNADSRACVRLSGAKVILGGEITASLDDSEASLGSQANLKGFACEYMTSGTVLIMGDPGPYAFSGMTGGIVYQKLTPEFGFDLPALQRRLARGASVSIQQVDEADLAVLHELFTLYIEALERTYQYDTVEQMRILSQPEVLQGCFVKVVPVPAG